MQLDRLVNFHKAVGDVTRIRIIALLQSGPLHGQALAGKLGVTPPTITHHMTKLREADLVYERRDKNTIYFYLNEKSLTLQAQAILKIGKALPAAEDKHEEAARKAAVLENFFNKDGTLKHLPAQRKKKLIVLERLVKGLKPHRKYAEKEINEYIRSYHEDYATIRREFIMNHFMYRENDIYELNPPELWGKSSS
ncbi:metalloregulator ArsR/SmtB family transcription factor [Paenibacillus timonensis]|uniref:Metalloregulator ArsR/SmtB family transcription factor n=1 Tax=Paenibacillus timonensis TaxID=225915 RepID=A0ABW3SLN0_9BACL|nr:MULTISPECIES: metalloregulator ArsR/SmtB family transcription factor [Paenibacillus]MCH1643111.1 metalloregulator ArsR/SmtB family transcription factor [Paenibacillus timonensis]MDU2241808.1 metalloregulator ArsR/SmtB family transcription factor [Paenibacillus sp.]